MRAALAAILAMVIVAAPLAAAGVEDAIAPAQVVADAAGRLINAALSESDRDGSADVARTLEARIDAFTRTAERDWKVPPNATFAAEAQKALVTAGDLRRAVAALPAAAEKAAVTTARCSRTPPTPAEFADARLASFALEVAASELRTALDRAPAALDARALTASIERLESWVASHDPLARCDAPSEFLTTILLRPAVARPGENVSVLGVATRVASVSIDVPTLDISLVTTVERERFSAHFTVPLEPVIGTHAVRVTANTTVATATLTVIKFPADLRISGPSRIPPGADGNIGFTLASARRDQTDDAVISINGAATTNVTLMGGRGSLPVTFPDIPGQWQITATFGGSRLVAATSTSWNTMIVEPSSSTPQPPAGAPETPPASTSRPPATGFIIFILLLLALVAAAFLVLRRRRDAPLSPVHAVGTPSLPVAPSGRATPISFFGRLAAWLRERGEATPGSTARELAARLRQHDVDPGDLVFAFERIRYGGEPETPSSTSRFKTWAADAWRRLTGAAE